ncbi:hypothetical protein [Chryseobacterium wanjuense]
MSKIRFVKGKITEIINEDYNVYSVSDVVVNARGEIRQTGVEKGVSFGNPKHVPGIELPAKCVVHFRPKNNWKGEDYGFDWMRLGETSSFGDKDYKDIIAEQYKDSHFTYLETDPNEFQGYFKTSPSLYAKLRNEYYIYNIPWKKSQMVLRKIIFVHGFHSILPKLKIKMVI